MDPVCPEVAIARRRERCEIVRGITEHRTRVLGGLACQVDVFLVKRDDVGKPAHMASQQVIRLMAWHVIRWRGDEHRSYPGRVCQRRHVLQVVPIAIGRHSIGAVGLSGRHGDPGLERKLHETKVLGSHR